MKLHSSPKAFTLVEVVVSVLIVGIISAASWMAVSVLNPTAEATSNRIKAENLLTKSQEEVYQVAQIQFGTLEKCTFEPDNTCGFGDIKNQFPDFDRKLSFVSQGTTAIKGSHVTITWNEFGAEKTLDSLVLLTSPKQNVPGNIIGLVTHATTGAILEGVTITVTNSNGPGIATTLSSATYLPRPDGKQVNYSFADPGGRFVLNTGTWHLVAKKAGYLDIVRDDIKINSNKEEEIPIVMTPLPSDAHIKGRLIDPTTSIPLTFNDKSLVNLYTGGSLVKSLPNVSSFDFTVTFSDSKPRSFTVATLGAFNSRLVGNFSCGFQWMADGWSSSLVGKDGNVTCSNPWRGNSGAYRLTVNPGG